MYRRDWMCISRTQHILTLSLPSPPSPTLGANPFPKVTDPFCRLPLPTLFYQLEATHLGDLLRLSVRPVAKAIPSLGFSRTVKAHQTRSKLSALFQLKPLRQLICFHGAQLLRRKDNSSRDFCQRLQVLLRYRVMPTPGSGILTGFPFERLANNCAISNGFTSLLGSTHPCPTAVHLEPFPTSVFKVLI